MLIFHLDFNFAKLRSEFVRKLLKQVAELGYDAVLWELEDAVAWDSCPECATPDSWSKDEFRELLEYSRSLKLEPIPLLQTIGHGEYVMMHEKYHPFREHPDYSDCYCTSNPEVRAFLKKWIDEYCGLFGELRHFHLGGDEAYRFGTCPECSKRNRLEMYAEHIRDLASVLTEKGIRPGIWGDMILAEPENIGAIPRDFMIWDWNYTTGTGIPETVRIWGVGEVTAATVNPEQLRSYPEVLSAENTLNPFYTSDFLKNRGFDVILCSTARSAADGPFCPNVKIHAPNIIGAHAKYRKSGLAGHCVTSWAIRLNPVEAGIALMALPELLDISGNASPEDIRAISAKKNFGFAEGFDAAQSICSCDNRLRILSAVQWSGLKDSLPAPPGHIKSLIKRWIEENEPYWFNIEVMFDSMMAETLKGLSAMSQYAGKSMTAAMWCKAGALQLKYVSLLKSILVERKDASSILPELEMLGEEMTAFFAMEQTRASAAKNSRLITEPLKEYLEEISE